MADLRVSGGIVSTHSRPKAAVEAEVIRNLSERFQHTAARRRLNRCSIAGIGICGFNTQPPEGGCPENNGSVVIIDVSTHSRPKAAVNMAKKPKKSNWFQHTAARRRLLL